MWLTSRQGIPKMKKHHHKTGHHHDAGKPSQCVGSLQFRCIHWLAVRENFSQEKPCGESSEVRGVVDPDWQYGHDNQVSDHPDHLCADFTGVAAAASHGH